MDVFTMLDERSRYSMPELQAIVTAWVMSRAFERRPKVSMADGHVEEHHYRKQSIYSLLYSLYGSVGEVESERGTRYQFTFNTWGYDWPEAWGPAPTPPDDPQRFGKNAYTGLYHFDAIQELAASREGRVHIVELGCGTGAGADLVCERVFPRCTYEAVDMQEAGVRTCRTRFAPRHGGRLVATRADATEVPIADGAAAIVAVCETHVSDQGDRMTLEDQRFFRSVRRILKPGGYLTWGNAIPDAAWTRAFDLLESIGLRVLEVDDVTEEAVRARDEDAARIDRYIEQALARFPAFRIPVHGRTRRLEAELAMKDLCRQPGTRLYEDLRTRADTYKVVLAQRT
jgi:SAM-dependent methyltransferase